MKTARTIFFSLLLTLFLSGIASSDISDDCVQIPGKYDVLILRGAKAIEFSEKCKCRMYIDAEKHFIIFLELPEYVCI